MTKLKSKKVIKKDVVLLTADVWNSEDSFCVLKLCTSKKQAIREAKIDSLKHKDCLKKEELELLTKSNQTQGRNENYLIKDLSSIKFTINI